MDYTNPIDIIALVVAIIILAKGVSLLFVTASQWKNLARTVRRNARTLMGVYALIALAVGYYVFMLLRVEEVAAVMLFTSAMMKMVMMMYPESTAMMIEEARNKHYLPIVILAVLFALWILLDLFG
ncbi:hypothetical protein HY639_00230 [Candidatus Woesearchaeota archaeon]|nr:hypothetical protein [Candidatus Woesearchaeota archaeon]